MNAEDELPQDVRDAIRAGRKIEAIKRLREHRNLGLKEAKGIVDAYTSQHPQLVSEHGMRDEGTGGRMILIVVLGIVGWLVYRYLA